MSVALLLGLLRRGWPWLLGGVAVIGAYLWIDHRGYRRGVAEIEARDSRAAARIAAASERLRAATDRIAGTHAAAAQGQQIETREIIHEALKIVERPVYRNLCIDADGAGLLDRARANANAGLAGEPAGKAGAAAADPAPR